MGSEVKTSHPLGFAFFFWGEFAERCSYYGMRAILALYMTERLGVDKGDAGTFMSLFIAACYFFPLVGGWIADNFLGKYWTIVLFSLPYVVAQFMVGIENKALVVFSLLLLAMGSGVIKPNISTLMGLTYDQQRPGQTQLRTSAFSWFYMAINIGAFLSQSTMPFLRKAYGYQVAFLFPAALMSLALVIFALGKRYYGKESISRKIVGDANGDKPADGKTVTGIPVHYELVTPEQKALDTKLKWQTLGRIGALFALVMIFWAIFDQSASTWIFFANTYMDCTLFGIPTPPDSIQSFNALFIVALVPLSVALFKVFPLKATTKIGLGFVLTGLSMVIMSLSGFMAGQAQKAVKVDTPDFELIVKRPAGELKDLPTAAGVDFDGVVIPGKWSYDAEKKKLAGPDGATRLRFDNPNILEFVWKDGRKDTTESFMVPAAVTAEEVDWVKPAERITVWWQVFAYLILTIAEILVSITGLELAYTAAPKTMTSFVTACWLAVVFLANLLINAPITQLYPLMSPGVYFAMLAGFVAAVVVLYLPVAAKFNRGQAAAEAANEAGLAQ